MFLLYNIGGYAPFGEKSLTWADANIQYLDFFSYFKDVLQGENNISYTFSKTLGGSAIAIYSYYLSSPFNFLVIFFDKTQLHTFFDILIILKLALAGVTVSYYLIVRFNKKGLYVIILSIAYVFSQYNIAQCSNIYWLDGVYMLPLILLGVYRLVNNDHLWKLSVPVAFSILFNWYSGGINCVFAIFWFMLEYALYLKKSNVEFKLEKLLTTVLRFLIGMMLGVLCSSVLFLPTIGALRNSTRGSISLNVFKDFSFIGELPSFIQNYAYGAISSYGNVALYCGVFPLVGLIGIFFDKTKFQKYTSIVLRVAFFIVVLMFYWKPFVSIYSLLKDVGSYWYRYSYVGIFAMIFIAANYYLTEDREYGVLLEHCIYYIVFVIILNYLKPNGNMTYVYQTVSMLVIVAVLFVLSHKNVKSNKINKWINILLLIVTSIDVGYNAFLMMQEYNTSDVADYWLYVKEETEQISGLSEYDSDAYRISQTSTRNEEGNNITANYNEAFTYNYKSISGYTSSPDDVQREFLDRIGYRIGSENMCIVNTSIIGADSLLGVKYVMSKYPINGYTEVLELGEHNEKRVYLNPFALPMAFTYEANKVEYTEYENPFVYQNKLYSTLYGEDINVYNPVEYELVQNGNISTGTSQIYRLKLPSGSVAVYGNLPWNSELIASIYVNDDFLTAYSRWLSPSVFYIPTNTDENEVTVEIRATCSYDISDVQFYAIDLDNFHTISNEISSRIVDSYEFTNGYVKVIKNSTENENLYLAVPYDKGWTITVNGKNVETELFGNCFYTIELEPGENIVEMQYHIPYLKLGILMTILGIIITIWSSKLNHIV
jgi:uncharacterized membrane protein YfhO